MPHALLVTGQAGTGKRSFARWLARAMVCEGTGEGLDACGGCRGCRLFDAGSHPDVATVEPEAPGKGIPVARVRDLVASVSLTRQYAAVRVVILSPAEALGHNAANALLKTLEEPPGSTLFVLVSTRPGLLPVTIRSRCQRIPIPVPRTEDAQGWLTESGVHGDPALLLPLAGGAPITARALGTDESLMGTRAKVFEDLCALLSARADPVPVAAAWQRLGVETVCYWLMSFTGDLIRRHMSAGRARLVNADLATSMQSSGVTVDLSRLFGLLDTCARARLAVESRLNYNDLLTLEDIAIRCHGASSAAGHEGR